MKDCWSILGISSGASSDDIKKAYRKLALQYHPDRKGGNAAKFREVHEAYEQALKNKGFRKNTTQTKHQTSHNEKPCIYITIFVFDFGHDDEIIVFKHSYFHHKVLRKKGRLTADEESGFGFIIKANFIPCVVTKPYFIIKGKNIPNTIGLNIEFDYYTYIFGGKTSLRNLQSTHILGRCVIGYTLWSQIIIPRGKKEHILNVDILSQKDNIPSNIYEIKIFMKLKKGTWFSRIKELLSGIVGYEPYIATVGRE